ETRKPALELADAFAAVGHPARIPTGQDVDIKPVFTDVDSHVRFGLGLLFGRFLALHAGPTSPSSVQDQSRGRTDHAHPRCQTPKGYLGTGHARRGPRTTALTQ